MTAEWALIVSAVVAAVGGIIVAAMHGFRAENRDDHDKVMEVLTQVSHTVGRVEGKVESHIEWHKETDNGRVPRRNQTGTGGELQVTT